MDATICCPIHSRLDEHKYRRPLLWDLTHTAIYDGTEAR